MLRLKTYFFLAVLTIFGQLCANIHHPSLHKSLNFYGFSLPQQKEALKDLFKRAGIIPENKLWEESFPIRKTDDELVLDILKMVQETQNKFWVRKKSQEKGIQERWETQPLEWMEADKEKTISDLEKLGFIKEIKPQTIISDAICILGSSKISMENRLKYAETLLQEGFKTSNIILLAGERYVTEGIDGTKEELIKIADSLKIPDWKKLTETNLITYLYNQSKLKDRGIPCHVIDTPRRDLPRPTTQTTIIELISWLIKKTNIKSIIFISNQPYIKYQSAIIESIFEDQKITQINIEIVGSCASSVKTKESIEGLGSYLWARTPSVLAGMTLQTEDPQLKEDFKKLYDKNPAIYNILPNNLKA